MPDRLESGRSIDLRSGAHLTGIEAAGADRNAGTHAPAPALFVAHKWERIHARTRRPRVGSRCLTQITAADRCSPLYIFAALSSSGKIIAIHGDLGWSVDGGGARVRKGIPFVGKWNERWKEGGKKVEFWFESNDF